MGGKVQTRKGEELLGKASGAHRKEKRSQIRLLGRGRGGGNVDCWTLHRVTHLLISVLNTFFVKIYIVILNFDL
jgi:hypothetical protein